MHTEAYDFIRRHIARGSVAEFGSRDVNGNLRRLFGSRYIGVDIAPGVNVDIVADAADWQPEEPVDVVVCCEVLEHTPRAKEIVVNMLACVRPGGLVLITAACPPRAPHSAVDGGPLPSGEFYANVVPGDLADWLTGCTEVVIEVHEDRGDVYARAVR